MVCVSLITVSSNLRRCLGDMSTGLGQYLSSSSIPTRSSVACNAIFILGCEYTANTTTLDDCVESLQAPTSSFIAITAPGFAREVQSGNRLLTVVNIAKNLEVCGVTEIEGCLQTTQKWMHCVYSVVELRLLAYFSIVNSL
jgi:hypothetical protein